MQRYNQGFGWFGPMEKCDSGKWCKAEEADSELVQLEIAKDEYFDLYFDAMSEISKKRFDIVNLVVLAATGWGVVGVAFIKYALTGHIL